MLHATIVIQLVSCAKKLRKFEKTEAADYRECHETSHKSPITRGFVVQLEEIRCRK